MVFVEQARVQCSEHRRSNQILTIIHIKTLVNKGKYKKIKTTAFLEINTLRWRPYSLCSLLQSLGVNCVIICWCCHACQHRPVIVETAVQTRVLKLRRRRKTLAGGRVQISCSRQAQAKSAGGQPCHGLSNPYRPSKLGRNPCRHAALRTTVSLPVREGVSVLKSHLGVLKCSTPSSGFRSLSSQVLLRHKPHVARSPKFRLK